MRVLVLSCIKHQASSSYGFMQHGAGMFVLGVVDKMKGRIGLGKPNWCCVAHQPCMQMNLRSVCFHRVASARGQPWLWWDFVDRLGDMCSMQKQQYTPECAAEAFKAVAGPQVGDDTGRRAWDACATIDQLDLDEPVPMLEAELKVQTGNDSESTVASLPTVRYVYVQMGDNRHECVHVCVAITGADPLFQHQLHCCPGHLLMLPLQRRSSVR